LILLDIMMPEMDGYEVCTKLKQNNKLSQIPVIFVTAMSDIDDEATGFKVGAVDYITKPVSAPVVRARVKTHLSLINVKELEQSQLESLKVLGYAAEFRDNETGLHVIRMSHYAKLLAKKTGLSPQECEVIFTAAPLHDVGKIGIPDHILLKPGRFEGDEFEIMKSHANIGKEILKGDSPLMSKAREIAISHHEKWDGSGYPEGLSGEEIPMSGRITAIADVFDALTTKRPYKEPWPVEKAIALIQEEAGKHFDPTLARQFTEILDDLLEVKAKFEEQ